MEIMPRFAEDCITYYVLVLVHGTKYWVQDALYSFNEDKSLRPLCFRGRAVLSKEVEHNF